MWLDGADGTFQLALKASQRAGQIVGKWSCRPGPAPVVRALELAA